MNLSGFMMLSIHFDSDIDNSPETSKCALKDDEFVNSILFYGN